MKRACRPGDTIRTRPLSEYVTEDSCEHANTLIAAGEWEVEMCGRCSKTVKECGCQCEYWIKNGMCISILDPMSNEDGTDRDRDMERRKAAAFDWLVAKMKEQFKAADDERLELTYSARDEGEKWRNEGDMYGWNFHQGRSAGTIEASFCFDKVRRLFHSFVRPGMAAIDSVEEAMKEDQSNAKR